jgi:hypothetical protein
MLQVPVNGVYTFFYSTFGATREASQITGAFTSKIDDGNGIGELSAAAPGAGKILVRGFRPYQNTEVYGPDQLELDALAVAEARLELPRYTPQSAGPLAPVFVGTSFVFAVHLESSDHRRVGDASLRATSGPLTQLAWNLFQTPALATGHHEISVTALSIPVVSNTPDFHVDQHDTPVTLGFDVIDHLDELQLTDVAEPPPSNYHLVCAYAYAGGAEVFSNWTITTSTLDGVIPAERGNCISLVPRDGTGTVVSFVAGDGSTAQVTAQPRS